MEQNDSFYNVQLLLNFAFIIFAVVGLLGFMDDLKTVMALLVVIILKQDLLRTEVKKIIDFVTNLGKIEE